MKARKPEELSLKQILSVPCPTCGAALDGRTLPEGKSMVCSISEPRASIRGVAGQLDAQTAVKLGVRPEGREEVGH
jgi:hypothetical protein